MGFRENLLRLRTEHSLTQEQLAAQLGVSRQSVAKWESDRSYPEMDKLIKMTGIFGCTLDELVMGRPGDENTEASDRNEPTKAANPNMQGAVADASRLNADTSEATVDGNAPDAAAANTPATDIYGYDRHMRSFALKIAWGVTAIILGVAAMGFFGGMAILFTGVEYEGAAVLLPILVGLAIGLALIIPSSLQHAAFTREHPVIRDFYSINQKRQAGTHLALGIIGGIAFIFAGIIAADIMVKSPFAIVYFISNGVDETAAFLAADHFAMGTLLLLIAAGIWSFINFGIRYSRINVHSYNKEALDELVDADLEGTLNAETVIMQELSPEERRLLFAAEGIDGFDGVQVRNCLTEKKRASKKTSGICGIIMIVATIIGLCLLFGTPYYSPYFWMAWVVGGLSCAIVSIAIKTFGK